MTTMYSEMMMLDVNSANVWDKKTWQHVNNNVSVRR